MSIAEFRVSERGQMALPAEARHRWGLSDGGAVEVVDLGDSLVILPTGAGGLRATLAAAIMNVISELTGGIRFTVLEVDHSQPPASAVRRGVSRSRL